MPVPSRIVLKTRALMGLSHSLAELPAREMVPPHVASLFSIFPIFVALEDCVLDVADRTRVTGTHLLHD